MKFGIFSSIATATILLVSCNNAPKEETVETTETLETAVPTTYLAIDDTKVNWKGEVAGVYGHNGYVNLESGAITLEGDKIVSGKFIVDMTGIFPTDSASYKDEDGRRATDLAGHLSTPDFFATSEYPTSTFEITSIEGNNVKGNLTVRGKTNEETMTLESLEVNGNEVKMTGKLVFDRQKYDVAWVHYMKDMVLSDDIEINFSLTAKKS